jgi:hypothetical protein
MKKNPKWRVHTSGLLKEIANNNVMAIIQIPLQIFGLLLMEVGKEAARINDEKLNELMMRLTIYSEADPTSDNYNPALVKKYLG